MFRLKDVSRLSAARDVFLVRAKYTDSGPYGMNKIHKTAIQEYPEAKTISLPSNIEDIDASEKSRFSPERARDITGSLISSNMSDVKVKTAASNSDSRVASYDCSGAVSLNSAMQTNVPDPFRSKGKSTHLNMPGGQWGQGQKYVSEDMNNSHHINTRASRTGIGSSMTDVNSGQNKKFKGLIFIPNFGAEEFMFVPKRYSSTATPQDDKPKAVMSRKEKLKAAVKDYGPVVIVFHVGISLISLGTCYLLVTSGFDISKLLEKYVTLDGAAANTAAPFVVAYAIHKTMAPARITVTLVSVPYIVKYLRRVGILKKSIPK